MNYQKIYENIILKAKQENRIKYKSIYYEEHHILPKCLNGGEEKENKILLTAREHFVCHKLLIYIYPKNIKIIYAFHLMACVNQKKQYVSSRDYELTRFLRSGKLLSKEIKEKISIKCSGEKNGMYGKGYLLLGEKNGRFGKPISNETRIKLKHPKSEEQKIKQSKKMKGKIPWNKGKTGVYSIETLQKMKIPHIQIEKVCCFCGLIGKGPNMTRYHFNNCKLLTKN